MGENQKNAIRGCSEIVSLGALLTLFPTEMRERTSVQKQGV